MGCLEADGYEVEADWVDVAWLDITERDAQLRSLTEPWIAEEGPLHVRLARHPKVPATLAPRGLAFDAKTTVHWDEAGVQVVTATSEKETKAKGTVAICHLVLVRQPNHLTDWQGPQRLERIDYLERGVCVASRWRPASQPTPSGDEHA